MNELTVDEEFNEFMEMFGDKIPDPRNYPRVVEYYIKLYKYQKGLL